MLQLFTFLTLALTPAAADTNAARADGIVEDPAGKPLPAAHVFFAETQPGIGIKPLLLEQPRSDQHCAACAHG